MRKPWAHGLGMGGLVDQGGRQVIESPPGGRTILLVDGTAGQGDHVEPLRGGKAPRSPGPRSVLESRQTLGQIAVSPTPDGVARTKPSS